MEVMMTITMLITMTMADNEISNYHASSNEDNGSIKELMQEYDNEGKAIE